MRRCGQRHSFAVLARTASCCPFLNIWRWCVRKSCREIPQAVEAYRFPRFLILLDLRPAVCGAECQSVVLLAADGFA